MEVAMKKFLLTLSLLLSATTIFFCETQQHTCAPGPIQLGDTMYINMSPANNPQRGMIMNTLLLDPHFSEELKSIKIFLGILNANGQLPAGQTQERALTESYENIVTQIISSNTYRPGCIESLEAFERAIMN